MQAKCPFRAGIWMRSLLLMGLPRWLSGKELTYRCRSCKRRGLDPWVRKLPGGGNGYPLQYSFLENPMDRGVWSATVHGVSKSWTQLKQPESLVGWKTLQHLPPAPHQRGHKDGRTGGLLRAPEGRALTAQHSIQNQCTLCVC